MRKVIDGKARNWWSSMTQALTRPANRLTAKARGVAHSADDLVRRNPWPAAGITALVAAGAGLMTARATGRVLRGRSR
jgi:ElaB/YqjD/DUF883 family membrane-anchored ribosome-binding protein